MQVPPSKNSVRGCPLPPPIHAQVAHAQPQFWGDGATVQAMDAQHDVVRYTEQSCLHLLLVLFYLQCSAVNVLLSMFYLQCSTFNVLLMCWTFMFRYMLYLYVSILSMLDLYISVLSMLYFYVSVLFMYGQCYCGLWSLLTVVHFFCFSVPDAYHPEAVELLVASLYCEPTCRPYGPPVRASP